MEDLANVVFAFVVFGGETVFAGEVLANVVFGLAVVFAGGGFAGGGAGFFAGGGFGGGAGFFAGGGFAGGGAGFFAGRELDFFGLLGSMPGTSCVGNLNMRMNHTARKD